MTIEKQGNSVKLSGQFSCDLSGKLPHELNLEEWRQLSEQHAGLSLETYLSERNESVAKNSLTFRSSIPIDQLQQDFKRKLLNGTPIEYLSNRRFFYDRYFYVDERVLIPRFETELLVEKSRDVIKKLFKQELQKSSKPLEILDLGCGSGCIGLSLIDSFRAQADQFNRLRLTLSDLSPDALKVARMNLFRCRLERKEFQGEAQARTLLSDRFESFRADEMFDLIVTNPPYLTRDLEIHPLTAAEPTMALYLRAEEYNDWFQQLFAGANRHLRSAGVLLMEGAPEYLGDLENLAINEGFKEVERLQDLTGRDRFLSAKKA